MKFAPVTTTVVAAPAAIEVGLSDVMVGPPTVNVLAEEEAVLEFWTVIFADPVEANWALGTAAVSEVRLPYVVASCVEPQYTFEAATKFVPVTVSVKSAPPAAADAGLSDTIVGPVTVNALAEEDAVLMFWTVIFADPAEASWALRTDAVSEFGLPYVVPSWVEPQYTLEPAI